MFLLVANAGWKVITVLNAVHLSNSALNLPQKHNAYVAWSDVFVMCACVLFSLCEI